MRTQWDIVIIGAGPAGMSAALQATRHGLSVLVLDRQAEPGGQIFRSAGSASADKRKQIGADYARGEALVREFRQSPATFLGGANVWHLAPGRAYVSHQGTSHVMQARQILIATGAMERPVPLPGWTLPGVLGAGAADVLLKSASMLPEGPVVLCGNGPLILQTVVHLKHFGIPIAGVALTGSPASLFKAALRMPGALLRPQYLLHGMGMGLRTFFGAPCHPAANDISIRRDGETLTVDFTSFGKRKSLQGTAVLLHEGVVPETRITRLARCRHAWNPRQRYWHAETDVWGKTNVCGIRVAGDSAGGNLALVLCHRLKAAGRRLPGALVLMSPWTDMTMSGASYAERAESDPMLTPEYIEAVRTAYAGGRDYASPDLSPLFADLTGFPPTLIQAGDHEILYSDAEMLCHALERAGVPCRFEVSEGMWHVFQMFPLRKAAAAMESVARFLLER